MLEYVMIVVFGVGLLCLALGAWMAWPPAGLVVVGVALTAIPILWVRGGWRVSSSG